MLCSTYPPETQPETRRISQSSTLTSETMNQNKSLFFKNCFCPIFVTVMDKLTQTSQQRIKHAIFLCFLKRMSQSLQLCNKEFVEPTGLIFFAGAGCSYTLSGKRNKKKGKQNINYSNKNTIFASEEKEIFVW